LNGELAVVLVEIDLYRLRLPRHIAKLQLLELSLHGFVAVSHVNFLFLGLVVGKQAEDILHDSLCLFLLVLFS